MFRKLLEMSLTPYTPTVTPYTPTVTLESDGIPPQLTLDQYCHQHCIAMWVRQTAIEPPAPNPAPAPTSTPALAPAPAPIYISAPNSTPGPAPAYI